MKPKNNITEERVITAGTLMGFLFFFVLGIISLSRGETELVFDKFFEASLFLAMFLFHKKLKLRIWAIALAAFALFLHHSYLYGNIYFGIPFDRIMHFTAGLAACVVFYNILLSAYKKPSLIGIFLLSVLLAMGLTSSMETLEFVGYSFLGEGEGILLYGSGDFGEWNNMSWDLIGNTIGAMAGAIAYTSFIALRKRINPSKTI